MLLKAIGHQNAQNLETENLGSKACTIEATELKPLTQGRGCHS